MAITKPDMEFIWASGGAIVEPSDAKKQLGWTAEVPPHQWENWIQNRQDQYLAHINERGIPEWDGLTNYLASGLSYVQGSDGVVYKSVAASGPTTTIQDPTTDATDTYWTVAFADVGAFLTQAAGDARYAQLANNLSDLTNAATARNNLSVYSKLESDNFGINSTRIDVASASTVNLTASAPNTRNINITGTTTITAFTVAVGQLYFVRFNSTLVLTNNASIVTQSGANITTTAGDTCIIRATAANVVEVLSYTRAAPPFTRSFVSTQLSITSGGALTVAHGLGTAPFFVSMEFVCVTADAGYSPGDRLHRPAGGSGYGGGSSAEVWPDATNINVRFGAASWSIGDKATGSQATMTLANWRVVFRAFV